jgi:hypothetical protein
MAEECRLMVTEAILLNRDQPTMELILLEESQEACHRLEINILLHKPSIDTLTTLKAHQINTKGHIL